MYNELEKIDALEFNNVGALLGIEGMEGNEDLLGALRRMPPIKRHMTINKLAAPMPASRGSRAEMEKHFKELPQHIKDGLLSGDLRLADTVIYSIKPAASKTIKMFETQDDKEISLRNISNGKLPKNQALLVSGIYLLAGISADASKDAVMATKFLGLEEYPTLGNGESNLKANKKIILPESSNKIYMTANNHLVPLGYKKLSNPRLIHDDIQIEFTLELGTMFGIDPNTQIFVGLEGTITTP
jgi:hypothetical protein